MSPPRYLAGLALIAGMLVACGAHSSSDVEIPSEDADGGPATSTNPSLPASTPSTGSPASAADASADVHETDAAAKATDGGTADASHALLQNGEPCSLPTQCAGGLCLPFKGKGLRCTKACTKDSQCPNNKNCNDSPAVCDI